MIRSQPLRLLLDEADSDRLRGILDTARLERRRKRLGRLRSGRFLLALLALVLLAAGLGAGGFMMRDRLADWATQLMALLRAAGG